MWVRRIKCYWRKQKLKWNRVKLDCLIINRTGRYSQWVNYYVSVIRLRRKYFNIKQQNTSLLTERTWISSKYKYKLSYQFFIIWSRK